MTPGPDEAAKKAAREKKLELSLVLEMKRRRLLERKLTLMTRELSNIKQQLQSVQAENRKLKERQLNDRFTVHGI